MDSAPVTTSCSECRPNQTHWVRFLSATPMRIARRRRSSRTAYPRAVGPFGGTVTIPPGRTFDEVIEEALDDAQCVVVLWSTTSVASNWVRAEAAEGARRQILVPALLDKVKIPLEFRRVQAADLTNWNGDQGDAEFEQFVRSISRLARSRVPPSPPRHDPPPSPQPSFDSFDFSKRAFRAGHRSRARIIDSGG